MSQPADPAQPVVSHGPGPPHSVVVPAMFQRWETLTFLHWDYPVDVVQRLLPPGLRVEPWDGRAWVALVPFNMHVRPPIGRRFLSASFPETNVRTYVLGPNGEPGVFFFSLDAASRAAVLAARLLYGLPYFLAEMKVDRDTDEGIVCYRSTRVGSKWGVGQLSVYLTDNCPTPVGAGHCIVVRPGALLAPVEVGEFEHYLTARYRLWNTHAGVIMTTPVEHPPWQLRQARLARLEQNLLPRAGLPQSDRAPLVHYSDGVDVRIGIPKLVRGRFRRP